MDDQEGLNFFSLAFGEGCMNRLDYLDAEQFEELLQEIQEEIEASEIGLKGNTDRENTSYLIARRRHAKWVKRHVVRVRDERFGAPPPVEHPTVTAARLKTERESSRDRQFLQHIQRFMGGHQELWSRIVGSFKPEPG